MEDYESSCNIQDDGSNYPTTGNRKRGPYTETKKLVFLSKTVLEHLRDNQSTSSVDVAR